MGNPFKAWIIAPPGTGVEADVGAIRELLRGFAYVGQPVEVADADGFVTRAAIDDALRGDLGIGAHRGPRLVWILGDAERDVRKHWALRTQLQGDNHLVRLADIWGDLIEAATAWPADPLIAIIDVCHAGPPTGTALPDALVAFAACRADEKALAQDESGGWLTQRIVHLLTEEPARAAIDLQSALIKDRPGTQRPFVHLGAHPTLTLDGPRVAAAPESLRLRSYRLPDELPDRPYPLIAPYEDPRLFFGRKAEIEQIARLVDADTRPILALHAASGVGKSSLLRAGVLPDLSGTRPVAYVTADHLKRQGLAALTAALFESAEGDLPALLRAAWQMAGRRPLLIVDQFEELLGDPVLAVLGDLIEATAPIPDRPCIWLLAGRQDLHGQIEAWLDQRRLKRADLYESVPLHPMRDAAFFDAIYEPLQRYDKWGLSIAEADARRLAEAFARARPPEDDDPLVPQLQCVLDFLTRGRQGAIRVPEDLDGTIEHALRDHLKRAIAHAVPERGQSVRRAREQVLVALRHLVDDGRRGPALRDADLASLLSSDAEGVLKRLCDEHARVLMRDSREGEGWYRLSHDQLAPVVMEMADRPGNALCELDAFVARRVMAFEGGDGEADRLGGKDYREVRANPELVRLGRRAAWWHACEARWRGFWRRVGALTIVGVVIASIATWKVVGMRAEARLEARLATATKDPGGTLLALCERVEAGGLTPAAAARRLREHPLNLDIMHANPSGCTQMEPLRLALLTNLMESEERREILGALLAMVADLRRSADPAVVAAADEAFASIVGRLRAGATSEAGPPAFDWIPIKAGRFEMGCDRNGEPCDGDEGPIHSVTLRAFELTRTEVTCGQYRRFVPDHHCRWGEDGPVTGVSWHSANAYAAWAGAALPTEAQWEYAARAGTTTAWPHGDDDARLARNAWTLENARAKAQPVATRDPNPWGLHDMHGNVWEWTADRYISRYEAGPQADPLGPSNGAERVMRGGSAWASAVYCRSAYRSGGSPALRSDDIGFRLARSAPPEGER